MLARLLIGIVAVYRVTLSPFLGPSCRFQPTCSEYAIDALRRHGAFRGGWLTLRRLGRCQPWGPCGLDPVPEHLDRPRFPSIFRCSCRPSRRRSPFQS